MNSMRQTCIYFTTRLYSPFYLVQPIEVPSWKITKNQMQKARARGEEEMQMQQDDIMKYVLKLNDHKKRK